MKKNWKKSLLIFPLAISPVVAIFSATTTEDVRENQDDNNKELLTKEYAEQMSRGEILYAPDAKNPNGYYDALIYNQPPLDPDVDDDNDGLKNKDEVYITTIDGKKYYKYNSHPRLKDTDGDGIIDSQDSDPLQWNWSPRDASVFEKLAYRDTEQIKNILNDSTYNDFENQKDDLKSFIGQDETEKNFTFWVNFQREYARYWKLVMSWHKSRSGFDAYWLTNQSDLPFIKSQTINVLAIRGTQGVFSDATEDLKLGFGAKTAQDKHAEEAIGYVTNKDFYFLHDKINDPGTTLEIPVSEIKDRDLVNEVYITGHSLGGYLAQVAGIKDRSKFGKHKVTHIYTFNAPKIKNSDYLEESNKLNSEGKSTHYVVENDNVVKPLIGFFEPNVPLGETNGQHSTSSFLEDAVVKKAFEAGQKTTWSEIHNYEPELKKITLQPNLLTINYLYKSQNLKSIKTIQFNQQRFAEEIKENVPEHYQIKQGTIKEFETVEDKNVELELKNYPVKYLFICDGKEIATKTVNVNLENLANYELPTLPNHSQPTKFEYELSDKSQLKRITELAENQTIVVQLKETKYYSPDQYDRVDIQFVDSETNQVIDEYVQKDLPKDQNNNDINIQETWIPVGYQLHESNQKVLKNKKVKVLIDKKTFTITYNFTADQPNPLNETKTFKVKYQENLTAPAIPVSTNVDYEYYINTPLENITDVEEDQTINVKLLVREIKHTTTIEYKFNDEVLKTQIIEHKPSDTINQSNLELPTGYELKNANVEITKNSTNVIELQKQTFTITYNFTAEQPNPLNETKTFKVKYQENLTAPAIPVSTNIDYEYYLETQLDNLQNVQENKVINVKLLVREIKHTTTIEYKFESKTIKTQVVELKPSEQFNNSVLELPNGYELKNASVQITKDTTNLVEIQKKTYTVTYNFNYTQPEVGTQSITIPVLFEESYLLPKIPTPSDIDYEYIAEEKLPVVESVTKNETFEINLNYVAKPTVATTFEFFYQNNLLDTQVIQYKQSQQPKVQDLTVPVGYHLAQNNLALIKGATNRIDVTKNIYQITFKFIDESNNSELATNTLEVPYNENITLPTLPQSNNIDFDWRIKEQYTPTLATENKVIDIYLLKELKEWTTTFNFINSDNNQTIDSATYSLTKAPSLSVYKLNELNIPTGFIIDSNKNNSITPNQTNTLWVTPQIFNVTVKYLTNDSKVIKTDVLNIKYGATLNINDFVLDNVGYLIDQPTKSFTIINNNPINVLVRADESTIPHITKFNFIYNNKTVENTQVIKSIGNVKVKPNPLENYDLVNPETIYEPRNEGDEDINVEVTPKTYHVVLNYVLDDKVLKTTNVLEKFGNTISPQDFEDDNYKYIVNTPKVITVAKPNQTEKISLNKDAKFYELQFKDEDSNLIGKPFNKFPSELAAITIPNHYELIDRKALSLEKLIKNEINFIQLKANSYTLIVKYLFKNKEVSSQTITKKYNSIVSKSDLQLPSEYKLTNEFNNLKIEENKVISLELEKITKSTNTTENKETNTTINNPSELVNALEFLSANEKQTFANNITKAKEINNIKAKNYETLTDNTFVSNQFNKIIKNEIIHNDYSSNTYKKHIETNTEIVKSLDNLYNKWINDITNIQNIKTDLQSLNLNQDVLNTYQNLLIFNENFIYNKIIITEYLDAQKSWKDTILKNLNYEEFNKEPIKFVDLINKIQNEIKPMEQELKAAHLVVDAIANNSPEQLQDAISKIDNFTLKDNYNKLESLLITNKFFELIKQNSIDPAKITLNDYQTIHKINVTEYHLVIQKVINDAINLITEPEPTKQEIAQSWLKKNWYVIPLSIVGIGLIGWLSYYLIKKGKNKKSHK
ncbi:lipase family protein [Mycoplasma hafezii]|uniref:lipase family protein n=1 Tax=Mycoplasma hafezii TaxID=525886 RepID=UPI003CFA283B